MGVDRQRQPVAGSKSDEFRASDVCWDIVRRTSPTLVFVLMQGFDAAVWCSGSVM